MMSLFEAMGGTAGCRKLSEAFYARVARDPVLRPLFPGKTLHCAIEEFAAFLVQFLEGPEEDSQRRWWLSLRESHLRHKIGRAERKAWIGNMKLALGDAGIEEPVRGALLDFFERSSEYVVNGGGGAVADAELARRWEAQQSLDQAVAAVRAGDLDRVVALTAGGGALHTFLAGNRSVFAHLLALMIGSGRADLAEYVGRILPGDPALTHARFQGRTLLHAAAAAGNLRIVELLLRMGADPDGEDGGGHTPLYSAGNECGAPGGASVVKALVQAGAQVDACEGAKRCTALHMAARRGNVEIAGALLDGGAAIEARDSLGETPLRRAVNCGKVAVAALLLARGADRNSVGSKGLTPLTAARTVAMRQVFEVSVPG